MPNGSPWTGQIHFGTSRVMYIGPLGDGAAHSHHSIQVYVSLNGAIRLRHNQGDAWKAYRGAIIRNDTLHELRAVGSFGIMLLIEVESTLGQQLLAQNNTDPITVIPARRVKAIQKLTRSAQEERFSGR